MHPLLDNLQEKKLTLADAHWVYHYEQQQIMPWSQKVILQSLEKNAWGLFHHQTPLGFLFAEIILDEWHLHNLFIAPAYRGRGLAYRWLKHHLTKYPHINQAWLEVRQSNLAAIRLYEKLGFQKITLRKNYYPNPQGSREDAWVMQLKIPAQD